MDKLNETILTWRCDLTGGRPTILSLQHPAAVQPRVLPKKDCQHRPLVISGGPALTGLAGCVYYWKAPVDGRAPIGARCRVLPGQVSGGARCRSRSNARILSFPSALRTLQRAPVLRCIVGLQAACFLRIWLAAGSLPLWLASGGSSPWPFQSTPFACSHKRFPTLAVSR